MRQATSLLTAAAAATLIVGGAQAAPIQVTLGASTAGTASFTGDGKGNLAFSEGAITGTASDTVTGGGGGYTITAIGATKATANGGGTWSLPASATFTYTNGADTLTETLTYNLLVDNSPNPHVSGTDVVTAIAGSAAFQAAFGPIGTATKFDYTFDSVGTTLDALSLLTTSETSGISSGEDVPVRIGEPTTLGLLGLGLLGLGLTTRRRRG